MKILKYYYLTFKLLILLLISIYGSLSLTCGNLSAQRLEKVSGAEVSSTFVRIVINEIMADPVPPMGLPDAEWTELFNNSDVPVRLKDWRLTVGTSVKLLPDSIIPAGEFAILCSSKAAPELQRYGKTIVTGTFPALRNSGNLLILKNAADSTVDRIDYSDRWYGHPDKKDGGWSLERMDPSRDCGQVSNWKASEDPSGGTPGRRNSVFADNRDLVPPMIVSATVINPRMAEIVFSEWMDTLTISNRMNFELSDGMGFPDSLHLLDEKNIRLYWEKPLKENQEYRLNTFKLTDLCGNTLAVTSTEIRRIILKSGDVLINEILFDPWPGGSDFLELFNKTTQPVPLGKLVIGSRDDKGDLKSLAPLTFTATSLSPGSYLALTTDTNGIFHFYPPLCHGCVFQVPRLPAFNNDQGIVVLLSDSMSVLDEFHYSEEMHHPLFIDPEGVSLERISPGKPASDRSNWHSASSGAGFATPGYQNSQCLSQPAEKTRLTFMQAYISPDNDGFNDELMVKYELPSPGWIMNSRIFDTTGRQVTEWLNNILLGTNGELRWNGKDSGGRILPPGLYVFFFELFNITGQTEKYRKVVVITAK